MKDIGREFLEKTKYRHLGPSPQSMGEEQPPLESVHDISIPSIKLPRIEKDRYSESRFTDIVGSRRSCRNYADASIGMDELAYLLWCTQGVKKKSAHVTFRNVPSAGARHALDTYLQINRVEGLKPGIYRYLALENALIEIDTSEDIPDKMVAACLGQGFVKICAVNFIWVADIARMYWRYTERGYRYILLDAGHVCQNLYLAAESAGLGACAIAAFDDDSANKFLDIDGKNFFVVYIASVGKKGI